MKITTLTLCATLMLAGTSASIAAAGADETVPALDSAAAPPAPVPGQADNTPPAVNLLSGKEALLTPQERQSVALARRWINHDETPATGEAGRVIYAYGQSLPSVVCAPLRVCDVELQPGETVNDFRAGDPVRWKISPAFSGGGQGRTTHVTIKPTDTALTTDLLIFTDRRAYLLKLVSRRNDWMPVVSFSYPEDAQAQWAAYKAAAEQQQQATVLPTGESIDNLDFSFGMTPPAEDPARKIEWRPVRVYTDGKKTYIEFPDAVSHGDLPALVALDGKTEALVNYRMSGHRFVVDKLLRRAALIRGVGHQQQRIELTYQGKL